MRPTYCESPLSPHPASVTVVVVALNPLRPGCACNFRCNSNDYGLFLEICFLFFFKNGDNISNPVLFMFFFASPYLLDIHHPYASVCLRCRVPLKEILCISALLQLIQCDRCFSLFFKKPIATFFFKFYSVVAIRKGTSQHGPIGVSAPNRKKTIEVKSEKRMPKTRNWSQKEKRNE